MHREFSLEWNLSDDPFATIGFALANLAAQLVQHHSPDLADLFPLQGIWNLHGHLDDGWLVVRISNRHGSGVPTVSELEGTELEEIMAKILPFMSKNYQEIFQLLGSDWFTFDRFTYVGPYSAPFASWQNLEEHFIEWLNNLVFPEVLKRNQARVFRAIPPAPLFNLDRIRSALWVLECEESMSQGTAFHLSGVGLITCAHVLGPSTRAFKSDDFLRKYSVKVKVVHEVIDLAILEIGIPLGEGLPMGSADDLKEMDHLAVTGFPNYRYADSGVIIPGFVIGFRMVSSIRRILTSAPIVAGNSGGPVLDKTNCVVGVAVTGADCMEEIQKTENHGLIPIDALKILRS